MKLKTFLIVFLLTALISCSVSSRSPSGPDPVPDSGIWFEISYDQGDADMSTYTVSYVTWIANDTENMLQHLFVTKRVANDSLSWIPLSFWNVNFRGKTSEGDVDAVSGATQKNTDFTVSAEYLFPTVRQFRLYFEIDYSFNSNDWFSDQPGIVYYADIDLDSAIIEYTLQPLGWAHPQDITTPVTADAGTLNTEMRYITHLKDGDSFGDAYTDNTPATHMVNALTVTVTQTP